MAVPNFGTSCFLRLISYGLAESEFTRMRQLSSRDSGSSEFFHDTETEIGDVPKDGRRKNQELDNQVHPIRQDEIFVLDPLQMCSLNGKCFSSVLRERTPKALLWGRKKPLLLACWRSGHHHASCFLAVFSRLFRSRILARSSGEIVLDSVIFCRAFCWTSGSRVFPDRMGSSFSGQCR